MWLLTFVIQVGVALNKVFLQFICNFHSKEETPKLKEIAVNYTLCKTQDVDLLEVDVRT